MNRVEPIRDTESLQKIKDLLYSQSLRNYMLFVLGINFGLRIGDLLNLKISDVKNKDFVVVKEKKTGKVQEIPLNDTVKREIRDYVSHLENKKERKSIWLFATHYRGKDKPMSRQMAYKILKTASDYFGIENVGTHTLRKTFGYHFYMKNSKDVQVLMDIFGHSDPSITLHYIGETREVMLKMRKALCI